MTRNEDCSHNERQLKDYVYGATKIDSQDLFHKPADGSRVYRSQRRQMYITITALIPLLLIFVSLFSAFCSADPEIASFNLQSCIANISPFYHISAALIL